MLGIEEMKSNAKRAAVASSGNKVKGAEHEFFPSLPGTF